MVEAERKNRLKNTITDDFAQFLIPAAGETNRSTFRYNNQVDQIMARTIESKRFPIKTKADYIRYCVYKGSEEITALLDDEATNHTFYCMQVMIEDAQADTAEEHYRSTAAIIGARINRLLTKGDAVGLRKYCERNFEKLSKTAQALQDLVAPMLLPYLRDNPTFALSKKKTA